MRIGGFLMKSLNLFILLLTWVFLRTACGENPAPQEIEKLDPNFATKDPEGNLRWYSILDLGMEGQGWTDTAHPFDRLPAKAEGVVRDPVWRLSHHTAGLCARFVTDSTSISARWTLRNDNLAMNHMPASGVSGLDLYAKDGVAWRWVAVGIPKAVPDTQAQMIVGAPGGVREYLLYLPLYNGVESVEIGIDAEATLAKAEPRTRKPIVIYGTSITQGGCASRPGMVHTAILGRRLNYPVINLGFSGNGEMDPELGDLLAELDPAVYVFDCAPNMQPELIAERAYPFVKTLRERKPETPIVLVENIVYQSGWFVDSKKESYVEKNKALRESYERLQKDGVENLFFIPCENLLGDDGEGTVDGVHPTDVGFLRMADAFEPTLRKVLSPSSRGVETPR